MTLTIVADILAEPGREGLVFAELQKLVEPTRREAGCLQYDLHQDNDDPRHFLFFETWQDRALWQAHMTAPHLEAYAVATQGAVSSFRVYEMQRRA